VVPGAFGTSRKQVQVMRKKKKAMSEKEMFLKAYERGNPQFWLNRTRPKKKKEYKLTKKDWIELLEFWPLSIVTPAMILLILFGPYILR